jgi:hypothetical protein
MRHGEFYTLAKSAAEWTMYNATEGKLLVMLNNRSTTKGYNHSLNKFSKEVKYSTMKEYMS